MSQQRGNGYFKDIGNFSQRFLNQIANDIRSNAENLVSSAFQNESCGRVPPNSDQNRRESATSSESPSRRRVPSSTDSSQATTPDEFIGSSGPSGASGSSSMGNSCGSKHTSTVKPSESEKDSAMLCDICQAKFTLFNRKKLCSECKAYFCGSCVSREAPAGQPQQRIGQANLNDRTCKRCKILLSNPPVRADLMELRVKDLQRYLISKKVNTKSCVEKKDLVELVIRQNGVGEASGSNPNTEKPRRIPQERQKSFPKSYVESTHRHEWMEKMENAQEATEENIVCEETDDDFIVVTSVEPMEVDENREEQNEEEHKKEPEVVETPVEPLTAEDSTSVDHEEVAQEVTEGAGALPESPKIPNVEQNETKTESEPIKIPSLNLPPKDENLSMSGSPRRFANQGLVYLSEIQNLQDVNELSVKQAKDILAMNRVNFKGVVEKDELLKHVARLWRQEKQAQEDKEAMDDSDLCKICMDNPVDCVMLECGHMCTCTTCGKQMAECPICRQYVVRVVRTFKA